MVYMPQYYRTAATKLKKELYEQFQELCEKKGVTVNMLLKEHIEADLGENKNERTQKGLENRDEGDHPEHRQDGARIVETGGEDPCPFC